MTDGPNPTRRFVRVYFDQLEKDHPAIFYDPTALSTWLRMLILSEKAWPAMPSVPTSARRADLAKMVTDHILEYLPNEQYLLEGWLKERGKRAASGRKGAAKRWDANADAIADAIADPIADAKAMQARAGASLSTSISVETDVETEPRAPEDPDDCLDTYHRLTLFRPWGVWSGDKLLGAAREYGDEAVTAALQAEHALDVNKNTLMDRSFARLAKDADRAKRSKPKASKPPKPARDEAAYAEYRERISKPGAVA